MFIPIEKNAVVEYSLHNDTTEPKTIFYLGYLTARQKAALAIESKKITKETEENSMWWFSILKFGLKGWKNVNLLDGKPYEFKKDKEIISGFGEFEVMHEDCFEIFTLDNVAELAAKLYEINYASTEEKKS